MSGTISGTGTTAIGYTGAIVVETVATTGHYDITAIGPAGGSSADFDGLDAGG